MNQQLVKNSIVMSSFVCKWLPFHSRLPMLYGTLLDIAKYGHEKRPLQETLQKRNQFKCKVFAWLLSFQKSLIRFYQFAITIQYNLRSWLSYRFGALGQFWRYRQENSLHVLTQLEELVHADVPSDMKYIGNRILAVWMTLHQVGLTFTKAPYFLQIGRFRDRRSEFLTGRSFSRETLPEWVFRSTYGAEARHVPYVQWTAWVLGIIFPMNICE